MNIDNAYRFLDSIAPYLLLAVYFILSFEPTEKPRAFRPRMDRPNFCSVSAPIPVYEIFA